MERVHTLMSSRTPLGQGLGPEPDRIPAIVLVFWADVQSEEVSPSCEYISHDRYWNHPAPLQTVRTQCIAAAVYITEQAAVTSLLDLDSCFFRLRCS